MGGPGSGNRWRYGAKSTTDDYRTLDVRRWAREGVLRPGYWGGWQWTRNGETVASSIRRALRRPRSAALGMRGNDPAGGDFERCGPGRGAVPFEIMASADFSHC